MAAQLPLDLKLPPRWGRSDFLPAPANGAALAAIDTWPAWPDPVLILCGPSGAGKSHLGAIWAERSRARTLTPSDLAGERGIDAPMPALFIDDADRLGVSETALFHLLNRIREAGSSLLMTASRPPDQWGLLTRDLVSRLRLAPLVTLDAPDDALLRAVLVKLFADRQLLVDESVVSYLALRLARSLGEARAVVDALDRIGLALGRRVTRPVAAQVLDAMSLDGEGP